MRDWLRSLKRLMRGRSRRQPRLPVPPRRKPPRRGKGEGSAPVPVEPRPNPTPLMDGAEAPLE